MTEANINGGVGTLIRAKPQGRPVRKELLEGFKLHPVGVEIRDWVDQRTWFEFGKLLQRIEYAWQWIVADWLAFGDHKYGDQVYQSATRLFGKSPRSWEDYAYIARNVQISERSEFLPVLTHKPVVRFDGNRKLQRTLLVVAEEHGISAVRDHAGLVKERDEGEVLGRAGEMVDPARGDRGRMLVEEIIEDREIVHGDVGYASSSGIVVARLAYYFGRNAGHDGKRRHVLGHHSPCADDCALADRNTGQYRRVRSDRGALADACLDYLPVGLGLSRSVRVGRAGVNVVREHHAVPDEDLVLDRDPLADERVRRDLAMGADRCVLLNLDEGADLRLVTDLAAVKIDERFMEDSDIAAEID